MQNLISVGVILVIFLTFLAKFPKLGKKALWPIVLVVLSAMLVSCGYGEGVSKVVTEICAARGVTKP